MKFLQEIGYDDIFNVDEINEIKSLYDKAQQEMRQNFENDDYEHRLEHKIKNEEQVKEHKESNKALVTAKTKFRAHFDMVCGLHSFHNNQYLASVSEDCTVKCWDISSLCAGNFENFFNEPLVCLRGHTEPVLTVTGRKVALRDQPNNF